MKNKKNRRARVTAKLLLVGLPYLVSASSNAQTEPSDISNLSPDLGKVIVIPFDDLVIGAIREGKNTLAQQTFQYDALGRLIRVIDATNGNRRYNYDAADNRTSVTNN